MNCDCLTHPPPLPSLITALILSLPPSLSPSLRPCFISWQSHVNLQTSGVLGVGGGEASRLQAEMLQLDLIDATGDTPGDEGTAPEPIKKEPPPVTMDTYRPKRPTTLNLFPQVPRTQVSPSSEKGGEVGRDLQERAGQE